MDQAPGPPGVRLARGGRSDSSEAVANRDGRGWMAWAAGLSAALLAVLALTGLYLAQFYNPNPLGAYDSVLYTMTRAPLGNWVRAVHYWAAGSLVLTVVAMFLLGFWQRAYRKPHTVTWWVGVGGGALVFLLIITGTVLRGDQEGHEAMAHLVTGGRFAGALGVFFTEEFTRSTSLLSRVFSLHTSLLPLVLGGTGAIGVWLLRRRESPAGLTDSRIARPLGFAGITLLVFAALGALALVSPIGIGQRPITGVEVTKPFWPLLWVYGLENTMGLWGMVLGPAALFGVLAAVPLIDRKTGEDPRNPMTTWLVTVLGSLVLALWLYGAIGPGRQHLGM